MTTTLTSDPNVKQFREQIDDWRAADVHIDSERRLVCNIALAGTSSKNGYRYSEQSLRQAVPHYESKPVFLDHAANIARPQERSARDLIGSIVNPRFQRGRVRGDIRVLDTEAGRTFLALAETNNPAVGMSHVVLAQRSADQSVVEKIQDVVSVDAVVFPATTTGLREQQLGPAGPLPGSYEQIQNEIDRQAGDHLRRLLEADVAPVRRLGLFADEVCLEFREADGSPAWCRVPWSATESGVVLGEAVTRLAAPDAARGTDQSGLVQANSSRGLRAELRETIAQRDKLQSEVDALQREQRKAARRETIEVWLAESGLPEFALSDEFRAQLVAADEPDGRRLISERLRLVQRCLQQTPSSREREAPALAESAIIAAIRGRGSVPRARAA